MKLTMRRDQPPIVAVAIDDDENSKHALKWAADNVLVRGQIFYLLHVCRDEHESQTEELILAFQTICRRKGVQCEEAILDGMDVPKAIIDFVQNLSIDTLVMGACSRGAIYRMLMSTDVPNAVCKADLDYCSIYVISKGKLSFARSAARC